MATSHWPIKWSVSVSVYYVAVRTIVLSRHGSSLTRPVISHDIIHSLMCQVLHIVNFRGSRRMENAPTSIEVFFTSNSKSVRRAIWFTWFSEPHDTTSLNDVLVYTTPGSPRRSPIQIINRARRCLTSMIEPTPMIQRRIPYILCILVILYVCSCGVWKIYMPSFQISIWSIRICLKITKMARPHRRPMSKRQDWYELNVCAGHLLCRSVHILIMDTLAYNYIHLIIYSLLMSYESVDVHAGFYSTTTTSWSLLLWLSCIVMKQARSNGIMILLLRHGWDSHWDTYPLTTMATWRTALTKQLKQPWDFFFLSIYICLTKLDKLTKQHNYVVPYS